MQRYRQSSGGKSEGREKVSAPSWDQDCTLRSGSGFSASNEQQKKSAGKRENCCLESENNVDGDRGRAVLCIGRLASVQRRFGWKTPGFVDQGDVDHREIEFRDIRRPGWGRRPVSGKKGDDSEKECRRGFKASSRGRHAGRKEKKGHWKRAQKYFAAFACWGGARWKCGKGPSRARGGGGLHATGLGASPQSLAGQKKDGRVDSFGERAAAGDSCTPAASPGVEEALRGTN